MAVGGVFASSELFMLQDKSDRMVETLEFMNRRLQDFNDDGRFEVKRPPTLDKVRPHQHPPTPPPTPPTPLPQAKRTVEDAPQLLSGLASAAQSVFSSLFGDRSKAAHSHASSSTANTTTSESPPLNSPADHIHQK
jgi:hypothetical protein